MSLSISKTITEYDIVLRKTDGYQRKYKYLSKRVTCIVDSTKLIDSTADRKEC